MPYIKVNQAQIKNYSSVVSAINHRISNITNSFGSYAESLDWDVKAASHIGSITSRIDGELRSEMASLSRMSQFLSQAASQYAFLENGPNGIACALGGEQTIGSMPSARDDQGETGHSEDTSFSYFKDDQRKKGQFGGKASDPRKKWTKNAEDWLEKKGYRKEKGKNAKYYDTSGDRIKAKDAPDFYKKKYTIAEGTYGGELLYGNVWSVGDRLDTDGDGTYGYVAVLEGEVHGELSAGLYVMDRYGKKKFSPGVNAEIGASVSLLHAEGEVQVLGDDMLGVDAGGQFSAGKAEAEASIGFQVYNEKGELNLQSSFNASAEAIAVEAEATVGLDILGGGVSVTGGINIGIGAHADIGYKDGVFKCDIGASLGIGVSLDFEVDIGGIVNTVCEKAEAVWTGVKNLFKGW